MYKTSHWFNIKKTLADNGITVTSPLFHATNYESAYKVTREGFKARAGGEGNDAYYDNSVCFTRNFDLLNDTSLFGGSDKLIFIVDASKLKQFKQYPIDWYSQKGDTTYNRGEHPDRYEYETRLSVSPLRNKDNVCMLKETHIPAHAIKAILYRVSYAYKLKPRLEEKLLEMANGIPLFTLFNNKISPISNLTNIRKHLLHINKDLLDQLNNERDLPKIRMREIWNEIQTLNKESRLFVIERYICSKNYIPTQILLDIAKRNLTTSNSFGCFINRPNINQEILYSAIMSYEKSGTPFRSTRMALLRHEKMTPGLLLRIALDTHNPYIKQAITKIGTSPIDPIPCPIRVLELLAKDKNATVRLGVVKNPQVTESILRDLVNDPDKEVRLKAEEALGY